MRRLAAVATIAASLSTLAAGSRPAHVLNERPPYAQVTSVHVASDADGMRTSICLEMPLGSPLVVILHPRQPFGPPPVPEPAITPAGVTWIDSRHRFDSAGGTRPIRFEAQRRWRSGRIVLEVCEGATLEPLYAPEDVFAMERRPVLVGFVRAWYAASPASAARRVEIPILGAGALGARDLEFIAEFERIDAAAASSAGPHAASTRHELTVCWRDERCAVSR